MSRSLLALASFSLALGAAQPAFATVPTDLCTGNPCTVSGAKTVDPGSVLSFGTADLVFAPTAVVTIGPVGAFRPLQIDAKSITLQGGAKILGGGDSSMVTLTATAGDLRLQASGSTKSRIDVGGNQAGQIALAASGDVEVSGLVLAHGSGTDSQGGSISIDARGKLTTATNIDAAAGGSGSGGGEVDLSAAGDIVMNGNIDLSAADFGGGSGSLTSDSGNITMVASVDVSGGAPDGSGGSLDVLATLGNITTSGNITGQAGTGSQSACGDGATVSFTAGGSVTIGAPIDVSSGTQCFGGEVDVSAGADFMQLAAGSIAARGPGAFGGGGTFSLGARNATLEDIDLTSPGFGGNVDATVTGTLSVLGNVDTQAAGSQGIGGVIAMQACSINVSAAGFLDARGPFTFPGTGLNQLIASGALTVAGQVRASVANNFKTRGTPPVITGTVAPAATISVDATLPDCAVLPQCGNNVTDPGEACDDGNNVSCDGCSSDCSRVDRVCGDGTRECGEQCDDGNNISGDGCEADCTLPAAAGGVLFPGLSLPTAGCMAEWQVVFANPVINPITLLPKNTQTCVDGDPTCDADGVKNGVCNFDSKLCLRVPDTRIPNCTPASIASISIKQPLLPGGPNPLDQHNAHQLADAVLALGGTVRQGNTVLQSGPALAGSNLCTQSIDFKVAPLPKGIGKRAFNVLAVDSNGLTMNSNLLHLWCAPNTSVCGNGVKEVSEACDDGNTVSCDGCSSDCKVEACGNGIVECNETCDDGPLNGTPGDHCSATCSEVPPDLRIPGGGAKGTDCAFEWSMATAQPEVDARNLPKTTQECKDNDPTCDFDPTVGTCRFRIFGCVGAADARLSCSATQVSRVDVTAPTAKAKVPADTAARNALLTGLQSLTFPAGPGEVCSTGIPVNVPAGTRQLTLRVQARLASGKNDTDTLKLKCIP